MPVTHHDRRTPIVDIELRLGDAILVRFECGRPQRRIGEFSRRATLPFNGYGDQVASLYEGMDLRANF